MDFLKDEQEAQRRAGVGRRRGEWVELVLDQLDYGLILVNALGMVIHVNGASRGLLKAAGPLSMRGGNLVARTDDDGRRLRQALIDATGRGLRTMLVLGLGDERLNVAVVPLGGALPDEQSLALVVLGRRRVCETLTADWYARRHHLSAAEAQVLCLLCLGEAPAAIARRLHVALSTVRTQIGSIRGKTGMSSIGAVLREVSLLPPMVAAFDTDGLWGLPIH